MPSFNLPSSAIHKKWSRSLPPILTVPSGATLTLDLPDASNNHITPSNAPTALSTFSLADANPVVGPVFVEGAQPGDVLRVDVLELDTADYGWTAIFPGFGLLADEFPDPVLEVWDLARAAITGRADFRPGISVPVRPFLGIMGVAPPRTASTAPSPPTSPAATSTAATSPSVPPSTCPFRSPAPSSPAATATPPRATARSAAPPSRPPPAPKSPSPWRRTCLGSPRPTTSAPSRAEELAMGEYAAMGVGPDLADAAKDATRGLIAWMQAEKGLSKTDAYILASVAANLKIVEAVNMPNYVVACSIPLAIFRF
ncbi:unnamed protein product [Parascedosporium putredinis]|uniref:Uncharacterized protein n=1 Tax=Parascedosporium putredinis TaxID=1442378 RepID=A0A9P1GV03_9PEZI|nr:unnamed protein product [Parascedosporium putredinis]CAI7987623.1 unnamed protein product [Parascedosporium putredinis]